VQRSVRGESAGGRTAKRTRWLVLICGKAWAQYCNAVVNDKHMKLRASPVVETPQILASDRCKIRSGEAHFPAASPVKKMNSNIN
jgi:hypothetical protein